MTTLSLIYYILTFMAVLIGGVFIGKGLAVLIEKFRTR